MSLRHAALVDGPLPSSLHTPQAVVTADHGGVCSFLGVVRNATKGRVVTALDYEAYAPMAQRVLVELIEETATLHDSALSCAIHHAVGRVAPGEVALAIHCASAHRNAAFASCRHLIERIKQDLPIWKHERFADGGSAWSKGS